MKREENNLEKNISRLVKLAGDSDKPSEGFSNSLTEQALNELKGARPDAKRERKEKVMKRKWKIRVLEVAAAICICFLLASLMMPTLFTSRTRSVSYVGYSPSKKVRFNKVLADYESDEVLYRMAHGGTTPPNGEAVDAMFFKNYGVNPFVDTEDDHLSTFATDVDTGSYTICRGYLHDGHLPAEKAVRVEEFINYFKYGYAAPQEDTFAVYAEAAPWSFGTGRKNSYLLRLGLKAKQVSDENRKPAILTFVIDVSGSMNRENRLGLVKRSLRMLVERLKKEDRIGIAVYGSRGRKVMGYKGLDEKAEILAAIESLRAGGSTYAEEGIRIGYDMAESAYKKGFINRVILCSDGVANVGQTGADDILEVIKAKAEKGITLSAIGFGMGNYNDVLMERLGDKGNGYYTYIDTIAEAKRIFEDNLTGTLQVIARDVKAQVDFNPEVVRSYRLIGYENRDVPDDKFRDDKYDGGEVGAGHSVTALYELKLWPDKKGTVATTYVRYKDADTMAVTEFKSSIGTDEFNSSLDGSSRDFRLATTVGEFAEILRKSYWAKGATLDSALERAQQLSKELKGDADVIELADLISKARRLMKTEEVQPVEAEEKVDTLQEWEEVSRGKIWKACRMAGLFFVFRYSLRYVRKGFLHKSRLGNMIFYQINSGRKILRIWMMVNGPSGCDVLKAAGLGEFSLEAYLEKLKNFSPPRGEFDPEGAWEHIYDVYPVYGKWGQHSEEHKGRCRIKREAAGDEGSFRLEVSSEVTYLDYGHGIHPTRSQLTTARIICKSDRLSTLQSWELESAALDGERARRPLSEMRERGVFADGTIKLTSPKMKTREICVSGNLTSNWSLFDAVQRLCRKEALSGSFTMFEDLRLVRAGQCLSFDGEAEFELGGKKTRLYGYHQIGEGILPIHYWLDEEGRLLFALGGVRVYLWHSD